MKLLVFAIATHDPVMDKFAQIFKMYMNSRPWIKSYLLYGNSNHFRVEGEEIHFPVVETFIPGILHKTLWAFRWALEEKLEFDYILRANLSSFWILDRLYNYLSKMPLTRTIISHKEYPITPGDVGMMNGSGMFFSRDVIEYLAKYTDYNYSAPDDREITQKAYYGYRANFIHKPFYLWIVQNPDDVEMTENINHIENSDVIQIRTRNPYHELLYKNLELRDKIDPRIHRTLFFKYYVV